MRSFIKGVDAAAVFKASDIARPALSIISEHSDRGCRAALRLIEDSDREFACVLSTRGSLLGVVSSQSLRNALRGHQGMLGLKHAFIDNVVPVDANTPVADLFGLMVSAPCPLPVIGTQRQFLGVISHTTLMRFLDRDTPPVQAAPASPPPLKLNPLFPTGEADSPTVMHEATDSDTTRVQGEQA